MQTNKILKGFKIISIKPKAYLWQCQCELILVSKRKQTRILYLMRILRYIALFKFNSLNTENGLCGFFSREFNYGLDPALLTYKAL